MEEESREEEQILEQMKREQSLGNGNISEIPSHLLSSDLLRSKHGALIESIVTICENSNNAVERWKALGALAMITRTTNACQLIVKKHQQLLVDITECVCFNIFCFCLLCCYFLLGFEYVLKSPHLPLASCISPSTCLLLSITIIS